jgi:hypothetical protein
MRKDGGFVLGLATAVGMVLVLSSLSLLGSALAAWRSRAAEQDRLLQEDGLHSAAHWIVDRLATSHRCLLGLPSQGWEPLPAACGAGGVAAELREGTVSTASATWQFRGTRWEPGAEEAMLALETRSGAGPWRSGRFRVALQDGSGIGGLQLEGP